MRVDLLFERLQGFRRAEVVLDSLDGKIGRH